MKEQNDTQLTSLCSNAASLLANPKVILMYLADEACACMGLMGLTASHLVFSAVALGKQREYVRLTSCFCVTILMSQGYDLLSVALKKPMTSLFQQCSTHPPTNPSDFCIKESFLFSFPVCPWLAIFPSVTMI